MKPAPVAGRNERRSACASGGIKPEGPGGHRDRLHSWTGKRPGAKAPGGEAPAWCAPRTPENRTRSETANPGAREDAHVQSQDWTRTIPKALLTRPAPSLQRGKD